MSLTKIKTRQALAPILAELKSAHKKIVFTNGCFDILHVGHVRYLQQAKALGDVLIVALNSDASIQKLKGPQRPLVCEAERAEVMAALEMVDIVLIFDEDTPIETLRWIQPDIHVKGGDYRVEDLPEKQAIDAYGGKIVILPFVEGRSTTGLIQKMQSV